MKRIIYIGFAAIMAFAFSSCQKETEIENVNENKLVKVVLRAEKAGETRTAAVESDNKVSYVWTEEDESNFRLYQVTTETNDEGKTSEKYTAIEDPTLTFSEDNRILTVTATVPASSTIRAFVAGSWTSGKNPRSVNTQHPLINNFDPTADILVSEDQSIPDDAEMFEGKLKFNRQVTVNKMTLKGLQTGETISKVVLASDNHLTGYYSPSNASMTGDGKELILQYENIAVESTREFPVYFTALPKSGHTLTVSVETTRNSKKFLYTKTFGGGNISFVTGNFGKFSVNLAGCDTEVVTHDYSGNWIIAGTDTKDLAATAWVSGNYVPASEVSIDSENRVVTVPGLSGPYKMTISRVAEANSEYLGLYTIADANGHYLSASGGSSSNYLTGLNEPNATCYWDITENADGTFNIIAPNVQGSNPRNELRINYNSGTNMRVSCYAHSNALPKVTLYPYDNIAVDPSVETYNFVKASSITSGKKYLIVAEAGGLKAAKPVENGKDYSYLYPMGVYETNNIITVEDLSCAFELTATEGGYTIKQSDDRYLWMDSSHNTFQASTSPTSGNIWSITINDGVANITNVANNKWVQYSIGYSSFGSYASTQNNSVLPTLYEYQEGPIKQVVSIAVTGVTNTVYYTGDTFAFNGTVTATYDDGTTADVTSTAAVSSPDMTTTGTKTVVITFGGKEASYDITVNAKPIISIPEGTEREWDNKQRSWNIQYVLTNAVGDEWETECVSDVEWITVAYSTQATDGTYRMVRLAANEGAERIGHVTFTYRNADPVTVTITQAKGEGYIEPPTTATILFGNNNVKINAANVTGQDDQNNTWTITTEGTESFTSSTDYYQVGSSKKPATSITFTTTLPDVASITSMSAKFGGFSGTAGTVDLKVGSNSIGTGALNEANDVTVSSTSTAQGTVLTVSVTGISKGVKVYSITVTYEN